MFMKPFETIIVGVDFSPFSKIVVKQAKKLADLWKAQLVFVHAIHDPIEYMPSLYMSFPNPLSSGSYKDRIKKAYNLKDPSVSIIAEYGTPTALINTATKKFKNSLIMVGYKGHSSLAEFFFGSTAQSLVRKAKAPIWIHRGNKVIIPKRVLIPHDLSKESNRSINIIKKMSLVQPLNYEVYFVREKPFPVLDYELYKLTERRQVLKTQVKIKSLLAKYPRLPLVATSGDVTDKIVKRTNKFDLLMMAHHNPMGLVYQSETVDLMKKVKTPMLIT